MISNMASGPITHVRHSNSICTENATYVALNRSLSVDLIFLDFHKTFDNASDQCLLKKLYHYGIKTMFIIGYTGGLPKEHNMLS